MAASRSMAGLLLLSYLRASPGWVTQSAFAASSQQLGRRRRNTVVRACSTAASSFQTAFALPLEHGLCVAVRLPTDKAADGGAAALPLEELHPREQEVLAEMQPKRQLTYAGGRIAMRRALQEAGAGAAADAPVLSDGAGAPAVQPGAIGSISHTDGLAAAFVRPEHHGGGGGSDDDSGWLCKAVGVDVERASRSIGLRIARRVLSEGERATLGACESLPEPSDLLLRVSIKEALYKALHPLVRRPIRWHSVAVQPAADGESTVDLSELERQVGWRMKAAASWRLHDGYFVSTAAAWSEQRDGVVAPTAGVMRRAAAVAASKGD